MAHHKSSIKRIRQDDKRRTLNRFYKKTTRTAIKRLRSLEDSTDAQSFLPKVISMIDRLAKRGTWHKNKSSNLKSKLMKRVASLA
jgi:small subunit ribosomal protein S20